jgi:hypothetical protein
MRLLSYALLGTVLSVSSFALQNVALAQLPPTPPSASPAAGSASTNFSEAAGSALDKLAAKANEAKNRVIPDGLPLPADLNNLVGGQPPLPPPDAVSPQFTQGQDKSITVTSEGKPESLFFTPNQLASIMRAKEGFMAPREAFDPNNQANPMTTAPHTISLAGIVYVSKNDWVIWLNGERVTQKNMPQRLIGVTVKPDRVHLRWMDIPHQRIINITLEPHQQYLLDSDTIVPIG